MSKLAIGKFCTEKVNPKDVKDLLSKMSDKELYKWKAQLYSNTSLIIDMIMAITTKEELLNQKQAAQYTGKHRNTIAKHMARWKEEGKLNEGKIPKSLLNEVF